MYNSAASLVHRNIITDGSTDETVSLALGNYRVRVKAANALGESAWSSWGNFTIVAEAGAWNLVKVETTGGGKITGTNEKTVTVTSSRIEEHWLAAGWWDIKFAFAFGRLPATLKAGQTFRFNVTGTSTGTVTQGFPGAAFDVVSDGLTQKGVSNLNLGRSARTGALSIEFTVPSYAKDEIRITARLWNNPGGSVTWVYKKR